MTGHFRKIYYACIGTPELSDYVVFDMDAVHCRAFQHVTLHGVLSGQIQTRCCQSSAEKS